MFCVPVPASSTRENQGFLTMSSKTDQTAFAFLDVMSKGLYRATSRCSDPATQGSAPVVNLRTAAML